MFKKVIISCIICFHFLHIFSQNCGNRFYDEVFDDIDFELAIPYGEAIQPNILNPNATQSLALDFYEPAGDTMAARPLIIWAFGGSFVFGSSLSPDIVQLCNYFSRLGYVNASIDYRLSTNLIFDNSTENAYRAVMKSTHDFKAAVRFFYKDALTNNEYRIDTSRIYIGGVSAGAIAAVHLAYLDDMNEIPSEIIDEFLEHGGLEGNSGNEGYNSEIAGVINLSGGIKDTTWITSGNVPIVSLHGTEDGTVPYSTEIMTTLGVNFVFSGSESVHQRAENLGIKNTLFTWYGAGHTPFVSDGDYMDTTQWVVRDFLYELMCEEMTTSISNIEEPIDGVLMPNPSSSYHSSQIVFNSNLPLGVQLFCNDIQGRKIPISYQISNNSIVLENQLLAKGIYFIHIKNKKGITIWRGKWIRQ